MKLICAGLSKTGTTSIACALRILGYKVYDFDEQHVYYEREWIDLFYHGKVPDFYTMFKDVDAVVDFPCNFFFEELMEAFPDAKVILSVRNEDAWVKSAMNQLRTIKASYLTKMRYIFPTYNKFWLIHLIICRMATMGSDDPNSTYVYRKSYRMHNDRVKSVVPAEKLLVYSVDQGWEPLCRFTGKKIPDQPFPHLNVKASFFCNFRTETELGRKIMREVNVVSACCVVVVALIGVLLMYCVQ